MVDIAVRHGIGIDLGWGVLNKYTLIINSLHNVTYQVAAIGTTVLVLTRVAKSLCHVENQAPAEQTFLSYLIYLHFWKKSRFVFHSFFFNSFILKHWFNAGSWNTPSRDRRIYHKTSNIVGNKIIDHSDVVAASPVGIAPTTSSFST